MLARVWWLVGVLVVLPAALLVALGVRTLAQDTRLVEAQSRERLDRAATRVVQNLERGLGLWDQAVAEVGTGAPGALHPVPQLIADVLEGSPDAVLVRWASPRPDVLPSDRLLYTLEPRPFESSRATPVPPALRVGEAYEIQQQDYKRAIDAYGALLRSADRSVRPWVLQRLARTEAKAGRPRQALRYCEALERETGAMIGDLPADLIGRVQRCELLAASGASAELVRAASDFYQALAGGRWLLEKPRYLYYSARAREWLAGIAGTERQAIDDLAATEQQKIRLADAVGDISGTIRSAGTRGSGHRLFTLAGGRYLAFWQSTPVDPGLVLVVLGEHSLRSRVWPAMVSPAPSDDFAVSLVAPDGGVVFGGTEAPHAEAAAAEGSPTPAPAAGAVWMLREQAFQDGDVLWRVRATPLRPDALYAEVFRRRWLYLAMLGVMVGGLLAASLVVGRTLKREVAVARLKSQFVSAVSHEFRSPLTGISQLSELLVSGKVTDEGRRRQYYELIHRESRRLSRLVEQVLDFARMEDGRKEYRLERVETSGWLRRVAEEFQQTPASQGKTIAVSVPERLPPLLVDPQAMAGAIDNLLDNAVKYSPGRDTVWLDASAAADRASVAVAVRDEGVGIPPDEQRHLFDRFFRGRQLADTVAGTGLGLSLVKHVVTAHGGEIAFTSAPGKGTTFTVVLPVERER